MAAETVPPERIARLVCVCPNPSIDKIAAVDRIVPGEIHRPDLLSRRPGGKGLNVARAAHRLGLPVVVVALVAGRGGEWIADELAALGISLLAVAVRGETRTCLSVLDRSTGRLTEFYEAGPTIGDAAWSSLESALRSGLTSEASGSLVAVSGSLPPGAPPDGHRRLLRIAAGHGALAAVDVGGPPLAAALQARPWLVKVNAAEAEAGLGPGLADQGDPGAAAEAILRAGASVALVTRGLDGAVLATSAASWRIGPPPAAGRYGVGSGDAMLAGFAAGLATGLDLPGAARLGAAVAAAQALQPGQGDFDPAEVDRILPAITLDRLTPPRG